LERAARVVLATGSPCPSGHRVIVIRHRTFAIYRDPARDATILMSPPPGANSRTALGDGSMADKCSPKERLSPGSSGS
jgi:hypothetical protein